MASRPTSPTLIFGSPDGWLWVKGGRRPVVGWLTLVDKTNQGTTNGWVRQFTALAPVEPKAGSQHPLSAAIPNDK